MSKPVILTGLRANNDLHIGNYLGAILPMVDMARQKAGKYQVNMFVPDLHSFTTPIDHSTLQSAILSNIRIYTAAGLPLDDKDVHVYRQSYIPAHSELTWILDCFTGMGEMSRMTQFKEKALVQKEKLQYLRRKYRNVIDELVSSIPETNRNESNKKILWEVIEKAMSYETSQAELSSVGLFNYPVLMASDILLYGAIYVPVGDDQTQHLEFTRDIAERMNKQFGELFTVPKAVKEQHKFFGKDQGLRIKDLQDPSKKMSKSDESGKGVIFLNDTPEAARKKIMSAVTDDLAQVNYDPIKQPGISNILDLLKIFGGDPNKFIGNDTYGPLKAATAEYIVRFLEKFQSDLMNIDDKAVLQKLESSENAMNTQANQTLLKVQKAVGLR